MEKPLSENIFKKLLGENKLCTLATASTDGKPEAATIEYASDDKYDLYFETFPTYRKYNNLKSNPRTSVVITQDQHTIQMDGTVEELSGEEAIRAKNLLITKHGHGTGFYQDPNIRFFRFTPGWIRILVDPKWPPKYQIIKE